MRLGGSGGIGRSVTDHHRFLLSRHNDHLACILPSIPSSRNITTTITRPTLLFSCVPSSRITTPPQHPPSVHRFDGGNYRTCIRHESFSSSSRKSSTSKESSRHRATVAVIAAAAALGFGLVRQVDLVVDDQEANVETEIFETLQKGLNQLNDIAERIVQGEHVPDEEIDRKVEETMKMIDDSHQSYELDDDDDEDDLAHYFSDDDDDVDGDGDDLKMDEAMAQELTEQMQLIEQLIDALVKDNDHDDDDEKNDQDVQGGS